MTHKKLSPAAGQCGPGSGIRIDSERPEIAQNAPKIQKNLPPGFIAHRFRLTPTLALAVAELHFGEVR